MEKKRSWTCTLVTQLCLCVALYLAFNIGEPQQQQQPWPRRRLPEFVFVSVRGGLRPLDAQTHLLKQIEDVVRIYGARFVVNISELGEEEDPLSRNANCCILPRWEPVMKIVIAEKGQQFDSNQASETLLHQNFVKYGVNVYMSINGGCSNHTSRDGVDYIGIASSAPSDESLVPNRKLGLGLDQQQQKGMADGFLLHRVTLLEMITYSISSAGKVLNRVVTLQKDKAAI